MFHAKAAFSGLSASNLDEQKQFYTEVLGLNLADDAMGLMFDLPGGGQLFIYERPNHEPATYTALNFVVESIDTAVDELSAAGVTFERYDNMPAQQDEKGVMRGLATNDGPDIAWFKDPSGNILSVLQDK